MIRDSTQRRTRRQESLKCSLEKPSHKIGINSPQDCDGSVTAQPAGQNALNQSQMQHRASREAKNNSRTMNRAKAKSCENISSSAVIGAERVQALQNRILRGIGSETAADAKDSEVKRLLALTPSQCYNTLANQPENANQYGSTANILQGPLAVQPTPCAAPRPTAASKTDQSQRTLPNDEASQETEQAERLECVSNKFYPATVQQ